MIDFNNKGWFKLKENSTFVEKVKDLIVPEEELLGSYSSMRDGVVFTSKRFIIVNVQGVIGKKVDYTSIPYSKLNAYSIETSGTFDLDAELDLFISGMGKLRFEFSGRSNIKQISRFISQNIF